MRRSSSQAHFAGVPVAEIPRSSFDRSHQHKTTFDAGYLIPIYVDEALPGDTFNLRMHGFARMATPIFPIMDNLYMDTHFFAVPIRLIWENFQKFMGEQESPGDSIDYLVPEVDAGASGHAEGSLFDYMGVPIGVANLKHSALFSRAYNLIFNEWYRDQNLTTPVPVDKDDGPDLATDYLLRRRGKRHDYFTSCLPWPQKGDSVDVPLGATAPVVPVTGVAPTFQDGGSTVGQALMFNSTIPEVRWGGGSPPTTIAAKWDEPALQVDLSQATSATINQLRQAFQIQRMLERDARGGTRYTEIIRSHFGVVSPDARLQRPEFLGGGSSMVNISPVVQTSASGTYAATPQGNLAAIGTAVLKGHGFVKSFTEHCVIIGLVSVRQDYSYQQGLNRMWSRRTRYDFYWPALSHIGEQAVLQKEIFCDGTAADEIVFGYQERFAEYRYKPAQITGLFRSQAAQSLDAWHLAQDFATAPLLNANFIREEPPMDRVLAVPSEPDFLFDSVFSLRCARPMPVYGVPGFMDHF